MAFASVSWIVLCAGVTKKLFWYSLISLRMELERIVWPVVCVPSVEAAAAYWLLHSVDAD